MYLILYGNGNRKLRARIAQLEHSGTHPRRIDGGGNHRGVYRDFGSLAVFCFCDCKFAQINDTVIGNNASKVFGVQCVTDTFYLLLLAIVVVDDRLDTVAAYNNDDDGSDPSDDSLYNFFSHNFSFVGNNR